MITREEWVDIVSLRGRGLSMRAGGLAPFRRWRWSQVCALQARWLNKLQRFPILDRIVCSPSRIQLVLRIRLLAGRFDCAYPRVRRARLSPAGGR